MLSIFTKRRFCLLLFFLFLFSSFYSNFWKIAPSESYNDFDVFSEALILGKLSRSQQEGIFTHSGFTGVNFDKSAFPDSIVETCNVVDRSRVLIVQNVRSLQYDYYVNNGELPDGYCMYLSQISGSGYFYSVLNKILPFDGSVNYQIFKLLNTFLLAFCFTLILGWIYRNFGCVSACVAFLLLFFSQWIVLYQGNGLWWSLWNFCLPFLVMLLLLEKRKNNPGKVSDKLIFGSLYLAVFVKCFFSGFEFITVPLVSIFCPVVYYFWLDRKSFSSFFLFSLKAGIVALLAVFTYMLVLMLQLQDFFGSFGSAIDYILYSYEKRTAITTHPYLKDSFGTVIYLLRFYYLKGNAFEWGFFSLNFKFHFVYLLTIIAAFGGLVFFVTKKLNDRKYTALLLSTLFGILCPLSWFIVFRDHSLWHPHLDFIVWYMPFLLLGFAVIGVGISSLISNYKPKLN